VQALMRAAGLRGLSRAKGTRTTIPGSGPDLRPNLVEPAFTATGPDQLWVADITYCRTFAGWVYAAFVIDVYSRRVLGWQLSRSLRTDLALDALEKGLWTRRRAGRDVSGLIHHSDKGIQYVAVRYTQRLAEAGAVASVGSTGDSYDNALAEAFQLAVQGRAGPQQGTLEEHRRPRDRRRRWGHLPRSRGTSTGSTTGACTARSAWFHRPSTRTTSTGTRPRRLPSPRQFRASTEPGTGQHRQ
jgi:transposase InsO family protein